MFKIGDEVRLNPKVYDSFSRISATDSILCTSRNTVYKITHIGDDWIGLHPLRMQLGLLGDPPFDSRCRYIGKPYFVDNDPQKTLIHVGLEANGESVDQPANNDGRNSCFWCGAPTRCVPGFNMRTRYDVCTKCGK